MDTKPIRELIEAARKAHSVISAAKIRHADSDPANIRELLAPKIVAAERALAEVEKPYRDPIFHLDPSTHIITALPVEIRETQRLADELSRVVLTKIYGKEDQRILALAYRKKRGLETVEPCES